MKKTKNISADEDLELMIKKRSRRVDMKKVTDVILALLLIYFAFFGYLCNIYYKTPGNKLLFVYQSMFSRFILLKSYLGTSTYLPSYVSLFILIAIGILQAYRQDFLFYSIKYNFWTVLAIIPLSWFWYALNYQQNFFQVIQIYFSSANWNAIALQTTSIGTFYEYIISAYWLWNFILLEVIYVGSGFFGAYLKSVHFKNIRKQNLEILMASRNRNNINFLSKDNTNENSDFTLSEVDNP